MMPEIPSSVIGLVAVCCILGGPFVIGIIAVVMKTFESILRTRSETKLKLQMIQRGFSAVEIERVCKTAASGKADTNSAHWQPIAPVKPVKA